jgi:hypothetical protein
MQHTIMFIRYTALVRLALPSRILMTAGKTVINMPFAIKIPPAGSPPPNIRGAFAVSGGKLILTNGSSTENTLVDMRHSGRTFAEREI